MSGFSRTPGLRPVTTAVSALALVVVLATAGVVFGRRALLLVRLVRLGKPSQRFDDVPQRVRNEAVVVLGQKKLLQRLGPGLIHAFIFWGFLVLFPTIVMALIGAVSKDHSIPWLGSPGLVRVPRRPLLPARPRRAWRVPSGSARCSGRSGSRAATWARPT